MLKTVQLQASPDGTLVDITAAGRHQSGVDRARDPVAVEAGVLALGGSQSILFYEFDGPRKRRV
jgi:hypothetical protein